MNGYLNRAGAPATQSATRVVNNQQPIASVGGPVPKKKKISGKWIKAVVIALSILVVILIAGAIYILATKDNTSSQIQSDKYQAVFLNSADGQVYFGKLTVLNKNYYKLTDIYYVRVEQVQPDKNNSQTKQNISLAKLGSEIHGPQDVMYVNRDQVLFWENLKTDGQVAKAIAEYIKNGSKSTQPTNPGTTTTP